MSRRRRMLKTEAREYFEMKTRVLEVTETEDGGDTGAGAERLWGMVQRYATDGEAWAIVVLKRWELEGARKDYSGHGKLEHQEIKVTWTGEVALVPKRYGIPKRKPDGRRESGFQLRAWLYEPWPKVLEIVTGQEQQRDRLQVTIDALRTVLELRESAPQALTPYEACLLTGTDPDSIHLDDIEGVS